MDDFTFTDVERIIPHAKRSTVQMWINSGLIIPRENASGRGLSRRYSFDNLVEIWTATELALVWGISTDGIRKIFQTPSFQEAVKKELKFFTMCLDRDRRSGWLTKSGVGEGHTQSNHYTSFIQLDIKAIAEEIRKRE